MIKTIESYIPVTAETGNISQAAQRLGISQPALSAHIKKVEEEFGITIFDRTRKPFRLTEEGRAYLEYSEKRDGLYREFRNHLADISDLNIGELTIGGATTYNLTYMPDTVKKFSEMYPGIELTVVDDKVPNLIACTLKGQVDVFISPTKDDAEELVYEKLFDNRSLLCVPEKDPANEKVRDKGFTIEQVMSGGYMGGETVDPSVFRDSLFLILSEKQNMGIMMRKLFDRYGFRPERSMHLEQAITALGLSMEGVGISLFNDTALRSGSIGKVRLGGLRYYLLDSDVTSVPIYACHSGERSLSRAAKVFIEMLESAYQSPAKK